MKKNKIMRIASVLLVLTLLSTCAISGTFAKYVTEDSATDAARVAKWGVKLQVDGSLFGKQYGAASTPIASADDAGITVKVGATGNNVVAPGTKNNTGFGFSLNGAPEVKVNIGATIKAQNIFLNAGTYGQMIEATVNETSFSSGTYYYEETADSGVYKKATAYDSNATYYTLEDVVVTAKNYYPVVYQTTDKKDNTCTTDSINTIAKYIADKLQSESVTGSLDANTQITTYTVNKDYPVNTDLSSLSLAGETITWAWAFSETATENVVVTSSETAEATGNDAADTILGLLIGGADNIVVLNSTSNNYEELSINDNTGVVINKSTSTVVACTITSFDIKITVTQVD